MLLTPTGLIATVSENPDAFHIDGTLETVFCFDMGEENLDNSDESVDDQDSEIELSETEIYELDCMLGGDLEVFPDENTPDINDLVDSYTLLWKSMRF